MWIVKLHQLSTTLCGFFRNFSKSVISSLSELYMWDLWGSIEINLISLFDEFGANVFHNLVERKGKTENRLSTFAVVVVINTEIFMSFINLPFYKNKQINPNNLTSRFLGNFFWGAHTSQPVWNSLWIRPWLKI